MVTDDDSCPWVHPDLEGQIANTFCITPLSPSRSPGGDREDAHDGEDAILTVIFSENKKGPLHPFPVLFSLCEGLLAIGVAIAPGFAPAVVAGFLMKDFQSDWRCLWSMN